MDKQPPSRAPLMIAIVLLLLPVLYVGSYLALVVPGGIVISATEEEEVAGFGLATDIDYRWGGKMADTFYWPLEQIDRNVRPGVWGGFIQGDDRSKGLVLPSP